MTKVSIIVPVYNAEKSLIRCLESILNQTFENIEIILINDGSTDGSRRIIEDYAKRDSRVIIINNENKGVSETRNIGINMAKGQYIQFVDSDDYLELDMVEKNVQLMENENCDLVITGFFIDVEDENGSKSSFQTYKYDNLNGKENVAKAVLERLDGAYIHSLWNKIFKREIIINNKILMDKNISLGEDLIFNLEYLKWCDHVIFDEKYYYHYVMKADESLTSKYRENKLELMRLLYDKCREYSEYCGIEDIQLLNNNFVKWMFSCFIDLNNGECNFTLKEKLRYINKAKDNNSNIINNTKDLGLQLSILKSSLKFPLIALLISKVIFIIKVKYREILYK